MDSAAAKSELETYEIAKGLFLLGSMSSGVTVYRQQVRAHNLSYALSISASKSAKKIAVIGAGIAGLTCSAGLLALLPEANVTIFEKRWDLCPLQQGSETRWLHPHIYNWPALGSRVPGANLPLLDWREGTAGTVVNAILDRFGDLCSWQYATTDLGAPLRPMDRLRINVGVSHLTIESGTRTLEWVGTSGRLVEGNVVADRSHGAKEAFDLVIIACGFGTETTSRLLPTPSYWRNETLGQPVLNGGRQVCVVSGCGDGAIVDLCRLTIERFQQGRILVDLLGAEVDQVEGRMRNDGALDVPSRITFNKFLEGSSYARELIDKLAEELRPRLRKDVVAILHASGKDNRNRSVWDAVESKSSFLNKILLLSLFQAGAFIPRFDALEQLAEEYAPTSQILRHGTRAKEEVLALFGGGDTISTRLDEIKKADNQSADELWTPGAFPFIPRRTKWNP